MGFAGIVNITCNLDILACAGHYCSRLAQLQKSARTPCFPRRGDGTLSCEQSDDYWPPVSRAKSTSLDFLLLIRDMKVLKHYSPPR